MYFVAIVDDTQDAYIPQKKVGKRKTGIAYRRKMKIKHREQIRKNTSYGYELLGKRKWGIQMSKRKIKKNNETLELLHIEYTWVDKLLHPFILVASCLADRWNDLRYRCQRFKKGYSERDVWEMRDWFVRTAQPMLRELSTKAYNYPEEAGEEQWRDLLWEMADLLEVMDFWDDTAARKQAGLAADDKSMEAAELISAEKVKARDRFFSLFSKWFYDMWY